MKLKDAIEGKEYIIQQINTDDEELDAFLFSLGCYSGEAITVVSHRKSGCVVSIKDARYNIDDVDSDPFATIEKIAIKRGFLLKGGVPDMTKAYTIIMNELRGMKIGAMSYERPDKHL